MPDPSAQSTMPQLLDGYLRGVVYGNANGPIDRLVMNYIQHYHQLPFSGVYIDHRLAYFTSLDRSWHQQTTVPIVHFMHSQWFRLLAEGLAHSADEQDLAGSS